MRIAEILQTEQDETYRKSARNIGVSGTFGTPEGIRIPDLPLRRRTLYPAELQAHIEKG